MPYYELFRTVRSLIIVWGGISFFFKYFVIITSYIEGWALKLQGEIFMKLKIGQTVRVGFAFLSISAFWQMYNTIIPLILTNTFHMNETISGVIMALDNVLALFLLPMFGTISDNCKSSMGKRKPFILFGTIAAVILSLLLPLIDNSYSYAPSMGKIYLFIIVLCMLLVVMGTYRSPAVALMPDITPKPLRSQANAIINLMGALGGIAYLLISAFLYSKSRTKGLKHVDYLPIFMIVSLIMIAALLIVRFTVNERKLSEAANVIDTKSGSSGAVSHDGHKQKTEETMIDSATSKVVSKNDFPSDVKKSLAFLLVSIAFWFISYNAVTTWFTTYANAKWSMSLGEANTCLLVANGGAILCYLPIGWLSGKFGRKKMILSGITIMTISFIASFIYTFTIGKFTPALYAIFLLVGMAWASISVNSLPMVLEMCKGSEIGKFTGLYYTFSMAAQIVTPVATGWLMHYVGYNVLFIYAAIFMAAAFFSMQFVKHGEAVIAK